MEVLIKSLPWIVGALMLLIALLALRKPLEWLGGLLARTGAGLFVLWLVSQVGGYVGISLGVNLVNALIMGLLGVPGFGLLLMLNWACAV